MAEAMSPWRKEDSETEYNTVTEEEDAGKLVIQRQRGAYIAISSVFDYIYRPRKYEDMCLYDWIRLSRKKCMNSKNTDGEDEPGADSDELDVINAKEKDTDIGI